VWVLRDGRPAAVLITPGLDDDSYVEVAQGALKEGDEVITAEQPATAKPNRLLFRL
jgi:hypothetical protein